MKKQNSFVSVLRLRFRRRRAVSAFREKRGFFLGILFCFSRLPQVCRESLFAFIQTRFLRDVASRALITPRRLPRART